MNPIFIHFLNFLARKVSAFNKIENIPEWKDKELIKKTINLLLKYQFIINENNISIDKLNLEPISELLYELKTITILKSLNTWESQWRDIKIQKFRRWIIKDNWYKEELNTWIYLITTYTLDNKEFSFHIPEDQLILDFKTILELSPFYTWKENDIHYSKTEENKAKTKLPFSDLKWLKTILEY